MSDPRGTPNPDYIGPDYLRVAGTGQILWPHVDLCRTPGGQRDRQLLCGAQVRVLGGDDTHAYVQADQDGYVGFVPAPCVGPLTAPTHQVRLPGAHAYQRATIKTPETGALSFGALLTAHSESDAFIETHLGHVPKAQLVACPAPLADPTDTARLFLGTPYLWGGNTRAGIDCSGLVQIALHCAGHNCPGDSDQQEVQTGARLPPNTGYAPNDLLFWKGHVALVTTATTMIHANAYHMSVVEEPIAPALDRIASTGGGAVTSHKRL